jgi:hypothetical protein
VRCGPRRHQRVGSHPLNSLDDNALSFPEAIDNASRLRRRLTQAHSALPGDIVIIDHIHVSALLVGQDRGSRHGDDLSWIDRFKHDRDELTSYELPKFDPSHSL